MRNILARLTRKTPGRLLLLALGLLGWAAACRPATTSEPGAVLSPTSQPQSYSFYLYDWTAEEGLVPVDQETLEDQPEGQRLEPGLLSADGSTGVILENTRGRASVDPEHFWIVVYDPQSGTERGRFHPPVKGFITGLSADGSRLLMRPDPYPYPTYPPPVEWFVVDTDIGEVLAHLQNDNNACFRQGAHFDPAGKRIYCRVDPDLEPTDEPQPLRIVAYDVESGEKEAEIELPEALIGGKTIERGDTPLEEFLEPALGLSPDGRRLAVVHAEADKITLLEAEDLAIERTFSLEHSLSLGELLAPKVAYAKGEMSGTIRQAEFSPDGHHLYVFTHEVLATGEEPPEERGLWLVDLERGLIIAEALPEYQIQWVKHAPDGSVYVYGTTEERLWPFQIREDSPSTLWRLDGRTLEVLAERQITGFRSGWLILDRE